MSQTFREAALDYHRLPRPGKLAIHATKPLANQRDLALAYSPGVAAASEEIAADPAQVFNYTARGNLVAVISNGTAVLGLGSIGPLAAKPVMEGKAVLFKQFANIDVFDIEIDEKDPDLLVDTIARIAPTFGAINLEDIKAPECFEVEEKLQKRLNIPVFHDDQHGTAICVAAAMINGLRVVGKEIGAIKLVCSGAGAAAIACLDLLVELGLSRENVLMLDRNGVVHSGRLNDLDRSKARYAAHTPARTLAEAIVGADVFLGLSSAGVLGGDMLKDMGTRPLVLALANPVPEILPEIAHAARPDVVIATGRSDYPNQVNNVLCFPFMFRAALDVGATHINGAMKRACVEAIAALARAESSDVVAAAYAGERLSFGPEYLIPKPFDPRLITEVAPAVAKAAMESGNATRPIADLDAYRLELSQFVYRTGYVTKGLFEQAKAVPQRILYANGEEPRVLRAVQMVVDEQVAQPILIGRPAIIAERSEALGLRIGRDPNVRIVDPEHNPRLAELAGLYHELMRRHGVTPSGAEIAVRTDMTVQAAMMLRVGEADALIVGPVSSYRRQLQHLVDVIGMAPGARQPSAVQMLVLDRGTYFVSDPHVTVEPDADQIAEIAINAANVAARFGIEPKVALLSHSNFGSRDTESSLRLRAALARIREVAPDLEVEGEMQGDVALSDAVRNEIFPGSQLSGSANVLIMPSLDSASIAYSLVKQLANGLNVGPITVGLGQAAHVLGAATSVRGILNMSAFAAVDAQSRTPSSFA